MLTNYQDRIDRLDGNEVAILERDQLREVEELEEARRKAQTAGDMDLLARIDKVRAAQASAHSEEMRELRERLEGEQAISRERGSQADNHQPPAALPVLPAGPVQTPASPVDAPLSTLPATVAAPDRAILQRLEDIRQYVSGPPLQAKATYERDPQFIAEITSGMATALERVLPGNLINPAPPVQLVTPSGRPVTATGEGVDELIEGLRSAKMVAAS